MESIDFDDKRLAIGMILRVVSVRSRAGSQSAAFAGGPALDRFLRWKPSINIGYRSNPARTNLFTCHSNKERAMTESQKLSALRDKLIRRRRALVEGLQATAQLNGEDIVRVQNEIEAVERAMAEERRAEFRL
jgi:hypothetical protein